MDSITDTHNYVFERQSIIIDLLIKLLGLSDDQEYIIENYFNNGESYADPSDFFIKKKGESHTLSSFSLYVDNSSQQWVLTLTNSNLTIFSDPLNEIEYRLRIYLTNSFLLDRWDLRTSKEYSSVYHFLIFKGINERITVSSFFNRNLDSAYRGETDYLLASGLTIRQFLDNFEPFIILFSDNVNLFKTYSFKESIDALDDQKTLENMQMIADMTFI